MPPPPWVCRSGRRRLPPTHRVDEGALEDRSRRACRRRPRCGHAAPSRSCWRYRSRHRRRPTCLSLLLPPRPALHRDPAPKLWCRCRTGPLLLKPPPQSCRSTSPHTARLVGTSALPRRRGAPAGTGQAHIGSAVEGAEGTEPAPRVEAEALLQQEVCAQVRHRGPRYRRSAGAAT